MQDSGIMKIINKFKSDIDSNTTINERNSLFLEDYSYSLKLNESKPPERWRDPGRLSIFPTWKELHYIVFKIFNKHIEDHMTALMM